MALPHINQLYNDMKDKGLLVYAVNQQEDKQDVQDFVTETKLALPVLLDSDNKVSDQYGADSIPETVVIGKDGIVKKVIIGVGPGDTEVLKQAIDAAMKG
jgi:peroxiredoxin